MMRTLSFIIAMIFAFSAAADALRVVDGDTIVAGEKVYRIEGIDAPEKSQSCSEGRGRWSCGEIATEALTAMLKDGPFRCDEHGEDGYGRIIATCYAGETNLGREMVRSGMAWAFVKYSDSFIEDEGIAKRHKLGIWATPTMPAWDYRANKWSSAAAEAPEGCPIKGNISKNGRIYHTPYSPHYDRTRISLSRGERWFCDEAEALEAGWRPPYR